MQISGKVKIANKWVDGAIDKNAFDYEHCGNYAKGRLSWSDVKKGKSGEKPTFVTTTKKFLAFGDSMQVIGNNLGKFLTITGQLKGEEFEAEGKKIKYDQVMISTAEVFEKDEATRKMHGSEASNRVSHDEADEIDF